MFRMLRKTRRRNPSLRERVEQARAEIERSRAAPAGVAGGAGETPRKTFSKLVTAWRNWTAAKPPLPAAVAGRVDPVEATLARVRRQAPAAASLRPPMEREPSAQPATPPQSSAIRPVPRDPAGGSAARAVAARPSPSRPAAQASPSRRIATPFPAKAPDRRRTSSDLALAGAGIALGLLCAFFPWYVFMNQDQFGVRAMRFSGERDTGPIPDGATPAGARILADSEAPPPDVPEPPVDSLTTASPASEQQTQAPGPADQPFPGDAGGASAFRVVHVANGRAMIEDDSGLWVVERGATLPDNSRVRSIEQRAGNWVVVTTDSRVFEMQP